MKVMLGTTIVPHINGGGVQIVDWLEQKLREYGHDVDSVRIPFSSDYHFYMEQALAMRLYHIEDYAERLICIRMPSYLLRHPQKYLWFIHHYREVYDLWDTKYSVPHTEEGKAIREFIMRSDDMAFKEAKKIFTNSEVISKRLADYSNVASEVLYPPVLEPEKFYCDTYGDYIYYPSRVCSHKRQLLAMEAMQYVETDVKLLVTGVIESPGLKEEISGLINEGNLHSKITIRNEWISEEEKRKYFAGCLAAAYLPLDEDSYGYPSLEAHHSCKAVISCTDSGGTRELIEDGRNGYMVESDPRELAKAFDRLYLDKQMAEKMGQEGKKRIEELGITWDHIIGRLTN
ncbi:MAG: glycosyltransferase family 4 protein [Christensenellaceae bacterium]|jgi:glycosyltransferase involved in cell wall biosynthesis